MATVASWCNIVTMKNCQGSVSSIWQHIIHLKMSVNNVLNSVYYIYVIKDIRFFATSTHLKCSFIPHVTYSFHFYCFHPIYFIYKAHLETTKVESPVK